MAPMVLLQSLQLAWHVLDAPMTNGFNGSFAITAIGSYLLDALITNGSFAICSSLRHFVNAIMKSGQTPKLS
jgi:hypothetical protein